MAFTIGKCFSLQITCLCLQKGKKEKGQKGKEANQLISGERCPDMGAVVRAHCGGLGAGCQVEDFAVGVTVE